MRGALILIEGLDRAGKSSQCDRLAQNLRNDGVDIQLLKFPDRTTTIGKLINDYLDHNEHVPDQAIHLLFSANRWEVSTRMLDLLSNGTTVILDRYLFSGIAFSAAKNVPAMSLEWCKQPEIGLPLPDLTIFLDVSEEVAQKRGGYGNERYEKLEFQRKVREKFYELKADDWCVINADGTVESVEREIYSNVKTVMGSLGPIKRLE